MEIVTNIWTLQNWQITFLFFPQQIFIRHLLGPKEYSKRYNKLNETPSLEEMLDTMISIKLLTAGEILKDILKILSRTPRYEINEKQT